MKEKDSVLVIATDEFSGLKGTIEKKFIIGDEVIYFVRFPEHFRLSSFYERELEKC
jgi:hypothetical protein